MNEAMAQVSVTISGKTYRMACDDGQEDHLGALAERLDQTIERLRGEFGEIGDQRLTVMAAITMADQESEAGRRISALEQRIAAMERGEAATLQRRDEDNEETARAIEAVAERVESLAERLAEPVRRDNGG
jgi:cell division protein ZapA